MRSPTTSLHSLMVNNQYVTRDTFGEAQKATYAEVECPNCEISHTAAIQCSTCSGTNRVGIEVYKDPVTDDGTKKSAKGLTVVYLDENDVPYLKDQATWEEVNSEANQLKVIFRNSKMIKEISLEEIRENVRKSLAVQ